MAETALITGASAGIGEEFARQLAGRGYDLILVARRRDRLEQLAEQLPTTAHVVDCDLASDAASLPGKVEELGVDVDLLVNNAGFGLRGRFLELDPEREAEMVRVNCEAVVTLTHAFVPKMVERARGGVITVASTAGMQPLPYEAVYGASKAFAISFMEALWMELQGTGVKMLVVNPGPVKTEWQVGRRLRREHPHPAGHDHRRAVRLGRTPGLRPQQALDDHRPLLPLVHARQQGAEGGQAPRRRAHVPPPQLARPRRADARARGARASR